MFFSVVFSVAYRIIGPVEHPFGQQRLIKTFFLTFLEFPIINAAGSLL